MQKLDLEQEQEFEEVQGGVIEVEPVEDASENVEELEAELESTAGSFNVSGFKCTKCGLSHGHDTDKHRASDSFSMNHEQAGNMEFNSVCHCGVHSLAIGNGPDSVNTEAARGTAEEAPVPESVNRQLR
jgi:hypothetical protein